MSKSKDGMYGAALSSLKVGISNAPGTTFNISVGGKFFTVVAEYDHYSVIPLDSSLPSIHMPRETDRYMHEINKLAEAISNMITEREE